MSISSAVVSVGTAVTALSVAETDPLPRFTIALYNAGTATVYVGASNVTTATGFPLAASGTLSIDCDKAEGVYGIVATGTVSVNCLYQGV